MSNSRPARSDQRLARNSPIIASSVAASDSIAGDRSPFWPPSSADVVPHVELGPLRERKNPPGLARRQLGVE
jgi:hypothetical protein